MDSTHYAADTTSGRAAIGHRWRLQGFSEAAGAGSCSTVEHYPQIEISFQKEAECVLYGGRKYLGCSAVHTLLHFSMSFFGQVLVGSVSMPYNVGPSESVTDAGE